MARQKVTPEVLAGIRQARTEGKTADQIAEQFGLGKSTVQRYISRVVKGATVAVKGGRQPSASKEAARQMMERIVQLRSQGYTYTEIGTLMNQSKSRVAYYGARADMLAKRTLQQPKAATTDNGASANENHVSYLFGKVEALIEHYADSAGVSRAALASGLTNLLRRKVRW